MKGPWKVQVHGDPNGVLWEISVIHKDADEVQKHWDWFDEKKLLVSHSGGPCDGPLAPGLGDKMVSMAEDLAKQLNESESKSKLTPCDPDIYPEQLKAWQEYKEALKELGVES